METKFNFNSQVCSSREQSEKLLALGLKKETADMALVPLMEWDDCTAREYFTGIYVARTKEDVERYNLDYIPAWSLGRLIKDLMPQSIHLDSFADTHYYRTLLPSKIIYMKYNHTWIWQSDKQNDFDKCVDTIEWLIKEGYFNKEYLV